jgi:Phage derived protein Gp49-like (DUF891)
MPLPFVCGFKYYGNASNPLLSDVKETYDKGSAQLKGRFLSRLKILAQLRRTEWHEGYCKKLEGECDGLYELRFQSDKVQQRPLGFFLSDSIFVILLWATEKNNRFVPKAACEIALRRKTEVLADGRCAHALWLALE